MAKDGADRELKKLFRFLFPAFVSAERGPRAESLADHQRRKRGVVDCTAAQAVAAPPWQAEWAIPSRRATKAAIAERRKFSALLKMVRAGLI
jgi:hypothetical protein